MSSYPPYAGPAGAAATAAGSRPELRRPYVPAPWRSTPDVGGTEVSAVATVDEVAAVAADAATDDVTPDVTLPSIDTFLSQGNEAAEAESHSLAADGDDDAALRGEDWAMSDAAADVVSLAAGLATPDEPRDASPLLPPLPMWSDDDMLDIMPVARPTDAEAATRLFGAQDHGAEQGEGSRGAPDSALDAMGYQDPAREPDVPQGSEAAAAALETLARRIRDGELPIPGYAPGMGDAAALAAALASLLGLRR